MGMDLGPYYATLAASEPHSCQPLAKGRVQLPGACSL